MKHSAGKSVSIVAPFYNESKGVQEFCDSIYTVINTREDIDFEVICVDDGSLDDTLQRLRHYAEEDSRFKVVELSRNFGKEPALTAGIDFSCGDAVIPIDADLQDPPELIIDMIQKWEQGAEVVQAKRVDRGNDSFFKRNTANLFYWCHNSISDLKIPNNVGDYRLMDRVVVEALKQLPERQRFMKGLFAWVGFRVTTIEYKRDVRAVGRSKFSGGKLWNLAVEGFTSFSTAPLRVATITGVAGALITASYAIMILLRTLVYGSDVPGYPSLFLAICFFGSMQLIGIGVLGEYLGRVYMETKNRPIYLVRKVYENEPKSGHAPKPVNRKSSKSKNHNKRQW